MRSALAGSEKGRTVVPPLVPQSLKLLSDYFSAVLHIQSGLETSSVAPMVSVPRLWSLCAGCAGADQSPTEACSGVASVRPFLRVPLSLSVPEVYLREALRGYVKDLGKGSGVSIDRVLLCLIPSSNLRGERLSSERRVVGTTRCLSTDKVPGRALLWTEKRWDSGCVLLNVPGD